MSTEISTDSTKVNKTRKNARLEARVTEEQKQLMESAAFFAQTEFDGIYGCSAGGDFVANYQRSRID